MVMHVTMPGSCQNVSVCWKQACDSGSCASWQAAEVRAQGGKGVGASESKAGPKALNPGKRKRQAEGVSSPTRNGPALVPREASSKVLI